MDHASSTDPAVQAQLDRLPRRQPSASEIDLVRIRRLLPRLGSPERALPPVFHVAGTNGKGSTCAFLRAGLEAAGYRVHAFTSPHLVRLNERIRIAGKLIADAPLAALLEETIDAAGDGAISFFEALTAAAFLAFAREPADACVVEVGLGGRLDATNVVPCPAACAVAQIGKDHEAFLGNRLAAIAAEKAAIAKPGAPLVTLRYPAAAAAAVERGAATAGALWLPRGQAWDAKSNGGAVRYRDSHGTLDLPAPRLAGAHQAANAGLAAAVLRHQSALAVPDSALRAMTVQAEWPARLQLLAPGPLTDLLPEGSELWLDGAHNPAAARAVAAFFRRRAGSERPFHLVAGLLANKDAAGVLRPFAATGARLQTVPVPGHPNHPPAKLAAVAAALGLAAAPAAGLEEALERIARESDTPPVVLVAGSLYLAGAVLARNGHQPD